MCALLSGCSGVNIWFCSVDQDHVGLLAGGELARSRGRARPSRCGSPSRTTSGACCRLGSTRLARCISDANFITSNMSRLLLHSAASWPSPTLMPGGQHLGHARDAVAELRVRARVVRDLRAGLAHQRDLGVGEPDAVRGDAVGRPRMPAVVGDLGRAAAEPLLRVLHLGERLVQVDVDAGAEVVRERPRFPQQPLRGERQPLDPDVDLDPAVRRAVRLLVTRLVVLERVQVVLVVGDVVRQDGADADLLGRVARAPPSWRYMSLTVVTPHLIDSL